MVGFLLSWQKVIITFETVLCAMCVSWDLVKQSSQAHTFFPLLPLLLFPLIFALSTNSFASFHSSPIHKYSHVSTQLAGSNRHLHQAFSKQSHSWDGKFCLKVEKM